MLESLKHKVFLSILNDKPEILGFVTNDGMWAAILWKGFMVHNGDHNYLTITKGS